MALRNWRRTTTDDGFVVGAASGEHGAAACTGDDLAARLGLVAPPSGDDVDRARYQDWVGRMQDRRAEAQAVLEEPITLRNPNWDPELLFATSRDEADRCAPGAAELAECRCVLGVDESATPDELTRAYRAAVKAHHPDRYATEPRAVQDAHAAELRRAVHAFKRLGQPAPA